MAHNSNYTKIWAESENGLTMTELHNALGVGGGLGYAITHGTIVAMAKYKAVKSSKTSALTATDRANARYGLVEPSYFSPNTFSTPPAWTYARPTAGSPNELFRMLDFNGYDNEALPPIAMDLVSTGGIKINGTFAILLWKDSYVNTYRTIIGASGQWTADQSLSIAEILEGGLNQYNNHYISFIFYRYNSGKTAIEAATLIATNKKFGDIQGSNVFMFYPQGATESGITYPEIPDLQNNAYAGRQYMVAICLSNTGPSSPTSKAYEVLPSNYTCMSLGLDYHRWDYATTIASSSSAIDSLHCVFNSGPTLSYVTQHSQAWNEYTCAQTISVTITRPAGWSGANISIKIEAVNGSGSFVELPGSSGAINPFEYQVDNVSVPAGTGNITVQLTTIPRSFIYKDAPKVISVSGVMKQSTNQKSMDNTLSISA